MTDNENNKVEQASVLDRMLCPMCGATIAVGSLKCPACGETVAVVSTPKPKGRIGCFAVFALIGILAVLALFMLPVVRRGGEPARRTQCKSNLRQIALALHTYHDTYSAFPPAYTVDAVGKPLHSWRTLILPFVDQQRLYATIDLTKPWDDLANAKARETALSIYRCPSGAGPPNHTTYLASVAPNGFFRLTEPRLLSEIHDRASETLMLIEVPTDRSVPWMSPHDADEQLILSIRPESKLVHNGSVQAALWDTSIRQLSATTPAATRRALISIAGNDEVGDF